MLAGNLFYKIKLSQTKKHTKRYGCLGFGFTRQFVMDRFGAPVLYVPGDKETKDSRDLDTISPHLLKLYYVLDFLTSKTIKEIKKGPYDATLELIENCSFNEFIENIRLAEFLEEHGYDKDSQNKRDPRSIFFYLRASIITCAIFIKRMSDEECEHKFKLLDEAEWRIPYITPGKSRSLIKPPIKDVYPLESKENPKAKIPFYPDDLKVLIFPDDGTRRMALDDDYFQCWLKKRGGFPISDSSANL